MGIGTKSSGPVDGKVLSAAMPFRVRRPAGAAGGCEGAENLCLPGRLRRGAGAIRQEILMISRLSAPQAQGVMPFAWPVRRRPGRRDFLASSQMPAVPAGRRIRKGTAARQWFAGPDRGISVGWGRGDEGGSFLERRFVVGLAIVCIRKSEGSDFRVFLTAGVSGMNGWGES